MKNGNSPRRGRMSIEPLKRKLQEVYLEYLDEFSQNALRVSEPYTNGNKLT